jgi:hypothetical protein
VEPQVYMGEQVVTKRGTGATGGNNKAACVVQAAWKSVVGMAGFEPTTSASRTLRSTKLSHIPFELHLIIPDRPHPVNVGIVVAGGWYILGSKTLFG